MATMNVIEAVRSAMLEEMRRDDSVFVLGEDVGSRGGVFLATQGFVDEFGEARAQSRVSVASSPESSARKSTRP